MATVVPILTADQTLGDRLIVIQGEKPADALDGGVAIGIGIFRQQLFLGKRAVGCPADYVGECTAAVDPEIP